MIGSLANGTPPADLPDKDGNDLRFISASNVAATEPCSGSFAGEQVTLTSASSGRMQFALRRRSGFVRDVDFGISKGSESVVDGS